MIARGRPHGPATFYWSELEAGVDAVYLLGVLVLFGVVAVVQRAVEKL